MTVLQTHSSIGLYKQHFPFPHWNPARQKISTVDHCGFFESLKFPITLGYTPIIATITAQITLVGVNATSHLSRDGHPSLGLETILNSLGSFLPQLSKFLFFDGSYWKLTESRFQPQKVVRLGNNTLPHRHETIRSQRLLLKVKRFWCVLIVQGKVLV